MTFKTIPTLLGFGLLAYALPAFAQQDQPTSEQTPSTFESPSIENELSQDEDESPFAQNQDEELSQDEQSRQDKSRSGKSADRQSERTKKKSGQQNQDQRNQSQTGQQDRLRPEFEGWVRVATDYNNDGVYDAIETIYLFDLEQARKQSQARTQRGDQASAQQQKKLRVSGTIQSLNEKNMVHSEKPKMVAELKNTDDKIATVCLGPADQVDQLNLKKGDKIEAQGIRAKLDGKSILMAEKVMHEGESITNEMPNRQGLKRYQGEVLSKRTATFQGRDGEYVIAKVETKHHGTQQVNLGSVEDLEEAELSVGDQIKMLARHSQMNNRPALIAQVIRIDGKSFDVRESTNRTLKKKPGQKESSSQTKRD